MTAKRNIQVGNVAKKWHDKDTLGQPHIHHTWMPLTKAALGSKPHSRRLLNFHISVYRAHCYATQSMLDVVKYSVPVE